jgi:hypothetical protein
LAFPDEGQAPVAAHVDAWFWSCFTHCIKQASAQARNKRAVMDNGAANPRQVDVKRQAPQAAL